MCVYEFKMLVPWKIELLLYENHITVTTCETLISLHKPVEITTNTEKNGNRNIFKFNLRIILKQQ